MSAADARRSSRSFARHLLVAILLLLALLSGSMPSGAIAAPTGYFAPFAQCPRFTTGVKLCLVANIASGTVMIDSETIPINKPVTLQGGIIRDPETEAETFVGALDGETLSRTPLQVPGGLSGLLASASLPAQLRKAYEQALAQGSSNVTTTLELVGTPVIDKRALILEEGTGLSLPARVRLENRFLGQECHIGSSAAPVLLNLTTGTTSTPAPNRPIKGTIGPIDAYDEFEYIVLPNDLLVDNAFPVPTATGCGGTLAPLLDQILDTRIGLPSPAGHNTAILHATAIQEATTIGVIASEK